MKPGRITGPNLLPQIETLFIYARAIAALGIVLWLFFSPESAAARVPVQAILALFAAHLGLFFLAVNRRWMSRRNIYWITLLFDVFLVTVLVRFTGGVESEFFLLYFLSVGFGAYYMGMNSGLLLSFVITLNYLLTNSQAIPGAFFGDLLMRLSLLWFFAAATGYMSEFFRQAEERLLRTLNTLNQRTSELEKAHAELRMVYETARSLGEHNDPDKILSELLHIATKILGYQHLGVMLFNQQRDGLLLVARMDSGEQTLLRPPLLYDMSGVSGYVARTGRPQRLYDVTGDDRYQAGMEGARSELAVPMISRGRTVGVLNAESVELGAFLEKDEKILSILAGAAAMALENARLHNQLEQQSTTDALTGVRNYRYFVERLGEEQKRARRYDQPLSLIMVDLDWFKICNDTYGHQAGNLVLKGIARILASVVRDTDVVCRYGGEEFIVILPQTVSTDAHEIGERIRQEVERSGFADEGLLPTLRVTVSIGVTTYPDNGGTAEKLVDMVDRALYQAKGAGKNVVCRI
jgi:diguanylate cyclase (GGDEF)-like protein